MRLALRPSSLRVPAARAHLLRYRPSTMHRGIGKRRSLEAIFCYHLKICLAQATESR